MAKHIKLLKSSSSRSSDSPWFFCLLQITSKCLQIHYRKNKNIFYWEGPCTLHHKPQPVHPAPAAPRLPTDPLLKS